MFSLVEGAKDVSRVVKIQPINVVFQFHLKSYALYMVELVTVHGYEQVEYDAKMLSQVI
mgnify:CR=1 FL=1